MIELVQFPKNEENDFITLAQYLVEDLKAEKIPGVKRVLLVIQTDNDEGPGIELRAWGAFDPFVVVGMLDLAKVEIHEGFSK